MLALRSVNLLKCNFKFKDLQPVIEYNIRIIGFETKFDDENNEAVYIVAFDLMSKVKKPMFLMKCSLELSYELDTNGKELLKDYIVIAHAIPYLREFVSNLTGRTASRALFIDPVNTKVLWNEYNSQQKVKPTTEQPT